jgi:hypothetical protein
LKTAEAREPALRLLTASSHAAAREWWVAGEVVFNPTLHLSVIGMGVLCSQSDWPALCRRMRGGKKVSIAYEKNH